MNVITLREEIETCWRQELFKTDLWKAIDIGHFTIMDYVGFLTQTFHYTRRSALIQASVIPHFQVRHRELVSRFLLHATEESEHYLLALQDIGRLGHDASSIVGRNPTPLVEGYLGFIFNQISFVNPISYLGYLYQLEYMAIKIGPIFANSISVSVPGSSSAMAFLKTHAHDDVSHVAELEEILVSVESEHDIRCITYTAITSAVLYSKMMNDAFNSSRSNWGRE
jgi:pyrroloquinoline quinone (PQQ) biosynthesis protein C